MRKLIIIFLLSITNILLAQNNELITKFETTNYLQTVTYEECIDFSQKLAKYSSKVNFIELGRSPQNRPIPLLIVDKDGLVEAQDIKKAGRVILFIQAGIHAGEPDGTDAGFLLLRDIIQKSMYSQLLDSVSILFIPSFNVDGLVRMGPYNRINQNGPKEMGWRTNSLNLNLNRDYMKAETPEIKAWLQLFNHYLPDLFIDCHTTDGADYQYVATYALETFGNLDNGLTQWVLNDYEPYLLETMEELSSPVFPYITFKNWHDPRSGLIRNVGTPMISQGYTALQNRIGLLIETHMLKAYKPRVFATYQMILATLKMMYTHASELKSLNHIADTKMSVKKFNPNKIAIQYETDMQDTAHVRFLGYEYRIEKSDLTGGDWFQYSHKKAEFELNLFEKQKQKETVELPLAYIIPVEWKSVQEVIKAHGIYYFITSEKHNINIDTYKFSHQKWADYSFEGHQNILSFETVVQHINQDFEAGAMVVPVSQRALKVLVYLLEPKADNSLVSWGYFNSIMERKEYAETYVMEKMAREMIKENPGLLEDFLKWKNENPQFANNQYAQTNWFYRRTAYWDKKKDVYPVGRILNQEELYKLGMH